jgi:hypothetical protein
LERRSRTRETHPLPQQSLDLARQLVRGILPHNRHAEVSHAVPQQHAGKHRRLMDSAANQRETQRRGDAFPPHDDVHPSADLSAHRFDRAVQGPAGGGSAIHLDHLVAGTDTGALGRRIPAWRRSR